MMMWICFIFGLLLGLLLGVLLGSVVSGQHRKQKAMRQRKQPRGNRERFQNPDTNHNLTQPKTSSAPPVRKSQPTDVPRKNQTKPVQQEEKYPAQPRHTEHRDLDRSRFSRYCSLNLNFCGDAPSAQSISFAEGSDYILNSSNRLIPGEAVFHQVNTLEAYLYTGLFWVFDVEFRDRRYSYEQLQDSTDLNRFVCVLGVVEPAELESQAGFRIYRLKTRGLLRIADM